MLLSFSINSTSATVGTTPTTATVQVSESGVPLASSVIASTSDGTATTPVFYTAKSQGYLFVLGVPSPQNFTVSIPGSSIYFAPSFFTVGLSSPTGDTINPNAAVGTVALTSTLTPPNLSVSNVSATSPVGSQPSTTVEVPVTLTGGTLSPTTVQYSTADGTAKAGVDYQAATGSITFPAGVTTEDIPVTLLPETTSIPPRTFTVTLSSPSGATISNGTGTVTIQTPPASLSVQNASAYDNSKEMVFLVSLSIAPTGTVTLPYQTSDNSGTVPGSASSGVNYVATSGNVTFAPGQTVQAIAIPLIQDPAYFGHTPLTFNLNLLSPTTSDGSTPPTLPTAPAIGSIYSSITPPTASIAAFSQTAPAVSGQTAQAQAIVTLNAPAAVPLTVDYSTQDQTAIAGTDYVAPSSGASIVFQPGQITQTIQIPIMAQTQPGGSKTFLLNLSTPGGGVNVPILGGASSAVGTILNPNPTPQLFVSSPTGVVGPASGPTFLPFVVSLQQASQQTVTVAYTTTNGSATAGVDYTAVSGLLVFPPGTMSQTVNVPVTVPPSSGPYKTLNLVISNPTNASLGVAQGLGTIQFAAPSVSINNVTALRPAAGSANATFLVALSGISSTAITLNYQTVDQTAIAGTDYTATSGTLTFAPGQTIQTIAVPILANPSGTSSVDFLVQLTGANGATITQAVGTGTINPAPVPSISINNVVAVEPPSGTANATFTVSLTSSSAATVLVNYSTQDGTARAGTDYTPVSGTLTFAPGTTVQTISVPILGGSTPKPAVSFNVVLSNPVAGEIATGIGQGTIVQTVGPTASIDNVSVIAPSTGTGSAVFNVTLSAPSNSPVTLNYSTGGGTAIPGRDYTATTGLLTFPAGTTVETISVPILAGAAPNGQVLFDVTLSGPTGGTIGVGVGSGTILPIPLPSLTINNIEVVAPTSGTANAVFSVSLSSVASVPVTVNFGTQDGTAVAGIDYTPTTGVVTIAAGQTQGTITVPILASTTGAPPKVFNVELSNVVGATIGIATGAATIVSVPAASLSVNDVTVDAPTTGAGNAIFVVTLSRASATSVTVNYYTSNGTAIAGTDYTSTSGQLTFAPGETVQTVSVPVAAQAIPEPNKTFNLTLTGPTGASLGAPVGVATIQNLLLQPSASINNVTATSPAAGLINAVFTVTLSSASGLTVSVPYSTADMTATAGNEYLATTGTLVFVPGQTTATISVPIPGTSLNKPTTTFAVNLGPGALNATIGAGQGIGTILNAVAEPSIAINNPVVVKPTSGTTVAVFNVTLSAPSGQTITVDYSTANATATAAVDYLPVFGTLTFAPGTTTLSVPVTILGNSNYEGTAPLYFALVLANPTNAALADTEGACGILQTVATPTLSINSVATARLDIQTTSSVFTVTLSNPSDLTTTVHYATQNITAVAGVDYTATSGTLTFAPGQTTQTITVPILDSLVVSPDKEFVVVLSNPANADLGQAEGLGTIVINDSIVVTSTADTGVGSLQLAILKADATPGPQTITFNIPGPLPAVINLYTPLPGLTNTITLDATTQPGYAGTPVVEIDGANAGPTTSGLVLGAGNTTVKGLAINQFGGSAIDIEGGGGNVIQNNFLGTDISGEIPLGNGVYGVMIHNSANNLIGGAAASDRNVISGNHYGGVYIGFTVAAGNQIVGNYIGLDATGEQPLPNVQNGVFVDNAPNNNIYGNVISANLANGVQLFGVGSTRNRVQNNVIGLDAGRKAHLPNGGFGILVNRAGIPSNLIGGNGYNQPNLVYNKGFGNYRFYNRPSHPYPTRKH